MTKRASKARKPGKKAQYKYLVGIRIDDEQELFGFKTQKARAAFLADLRAQSRHDDNIELITAEP